ncbi:hypothetical protein AMELA_G00145290 [Ameiurus melas]|uniref:Complex III assembly factor LYRM7 n=1 Tax=Ameiurus melas TaxID=219545 RepID=A0A7J6AG04_AMEME|nr:hypothetical protein AMELA_G00145290 [Ameiurus melas]
MGTRLKVLRTFKALHRTRMTVFKDDDRALTAARLKINEEFKKNKNETSKENIQQMIKMSRSVETILRENIIQAEHVGENKLVLRPRESLFLENARAQVIYLSACVWRTEDSRGQIEEPCTSV